MMPSPSVVSALSALEYILFTISDSLAYVGSMIMGVSVLTGNAAMISSKVTVIDMVGEFFSKYY